MEGPEVVRGAQEGGGEEGEGEESRGLRARARTTPASAEVEIAAQEVVGVGRVEQEESGAALVVVDDVAREADEGEGGRGQARWWSESGRV